MEASGLEPELRAAAEAPDAHLEADRLCLQIGTASCLALTLCAVIRDLPPAQQSPNHYFRAALAAAPAISVGPTLLSRLVGKVASADGSADRHVGLAARLALDVIRGFGACLTVLEALDMGSSGPASKKVARRLRSTTLTPQAMVRCLESCLDWASASSTWRLLRDEYSTDPGAALSLCMLGHAPAPKMRPCASAPRPGMMPSLPAVGSCVQVATNLGRTLRATR